MTHSMETLLKETKDLRQQLRDKDMRIDKLESSLKHCLPEQMNTYSVLRFDETNNNSLARGGTFDQHQLTHDRPEQFTVT